MKPRLFPGSLAHASAQFRRLGQLLGLTTEVLDAAEVEPTDTPSTATAKIQAAAGRKAWRSACARGSVLSASSVLMLAIKARQADEEPDEDENSDESCTSCGHPRSKHPGAGECALASCDCDEFEPSAEGDEDEPPAKQKPGDEEPPVDEAMMRRIAASSGRPLEQVRAAARSMSSRPALVRNTFIAAAASTSRRAPTTKSAASAGVTAADREIAARRGLDPLAVAASRRALGLK